MSCAAKNASACPPFSGRLVAAVRGILLRSIEATALLKLLAALAAAPYLPAAQSAAFPESRIAPP